MFRNRQNVFTTIMSNFKKPKGWKKIYTPSFYWLRQFIEFLLGQYFFSMTEEKRNRYSLEDFRPINKISYQIYSTFGLYGIWSRDQPDLYLYTHQKMVSFTFYKKKIKYHIDKEACKLFWFCISYNFEWTI